MAQRLELSVLCTAPEEISVGGPPTKVPLTLETGLTCAGTSKSGSCWVKGICVCRSAGPLSSLPGEAFMSLEPHMGQAISEQDVLAG